MSETLHIKNMVCRRCVMTVEAICRELGMDDARVAMGSVTTDEPICEPLRTRLQQRLEDVGFELLKSRDVQLVEQAKAVIRSMARGDGGYKYKLSAYVEEKVGEDFTMLSRLFSDLEGRSMQTYLMQQRIEYVKEMLQYDELTLSEISDRAGFSSVAHLSRAFKSVQGSTISDYRIAQSRLGLDEV